MNDYLFSYGTLQKESVPQALFGRTLAGEKDTLLGFRIVLVEINDAAFLAKGEDSIQRTLVKTGVQQDHIEGTVLSITKDELAMADKYEPANYQRVQVVLESGTKAWIYKAVDEPNV